MPEGESFASWTKVVMSSTRGLPRLLLLSRDRGSDPSSDRRRGLDERSRLTGLSGSEAGRSVHLRDQGYAGGRGDEEPHFLEEEEPSHHSRASEVKGVRGTEGVERVTICCGVTGDEDGDCSRMWVTVVPGTKCASSP